MSWRLDPANYDFVYDEMKRKKMKSMNKALNQILGDLRQYKIPFPPESAATSSESAATPLTSDEDKQRL